MNPTPETDPAATPSAEAPPAGPYQSLEISRGSVSALAAVSYVAILILFGVLAQLVQALNLPLGLILSSLLLFGSAGLFFPSLLGQNPWRFTGLTRFPLPLVGLAFLIGAANLPFANFLMGAAREFMPERLVHAADEVTKVLVRADATTRLLLVVGAGLAAPLGEELFFRGWMQRILVQRFSLLASALVVAFAFSLIHLDPVGFVARLELGLLFGLVSAWARSLWAGIAMHAAHNLLSTAALYLVAEDPLKELDQPFEWGQAAALGILGCTAMLALLFAYRRLARRQPVPEQQALVRPRITIVPALKVAAISTALVLGALVLMWQRRDALPGEELTRSLRLQIFKFSNPVQPTHPQ